MSCPDSWHISLGVVFLCIFLPPTVKSHLMFHPHLMVSLVQPKARAFVVVVWRDPSSWGDSYFVVTFLVLKFFSLKKTLLYTFPLP